MDAQGNLVTFPFFSIWENGPVALGWLRVSHRELDTERSTPQQPWLTLLVEGRWDDDNEEILTVVRQELNDGAGSNLINLSSGTRIDQLVNAAAVASHQGASPGKLTPSSSNGSRTRRLRNSYVLASCIDAANKLSSLPSPVDEVDCWKRLSIISQAWGDGWVLTSAVDAIPPDIDLHMVAAVAGDQDEELSAVLTREAGYRAQRGNAEWWKDQEISSRTDFERRQAHASVVLQLSQKSTK